MERLVLKERAAARISARVGRKSCDSLGLNLDHGQFLVIRITSRSWLIAHCVQALMIHLHLLRPILANSRAHSPQDMGGYIVSYFVR